MSLSSLNFEFDQQEVTDNLLNLSLDTNECVQSFPSRIEMDSKENHHTPILVEDALQELNFEKGDPDFLGVESFLENFGIWGVGDQIFHGSKFCKSLKELLCTQLLTKAKLVCLKTLKHKPKTATTMALAILAYHGVLSHSFGCIFLVSLHIFVLHCLYVFEFLSYLLFAIRWQDPP